MLVLLLLWIFILLGLSTKSLLYLVRSNKSSSTSHDYLLQCLHDITRTSLRRTVPIRSASYSLQLTMAPCVSLLDISCERSEFPAEIRTQSFADLRRAYKLRILLSLSNFVLKKVYRSVFMRFSPVFVRPFIFSTPSSLLTANQTCCNRYILIFLPHTVIDSL